MNKRSLFTIVAVAVFILLGFVIFNNIQNLETPISPDNNAGNSNDAHPETQTVYLYYPNTSVNPTLDVCDPDTLAPTQRTIISDNPIKDTIQLLIAADLTEEEVAEGFETEFPNPDFELLDLDLSDDGTLTLTFTEVPGFTMGGSCRTGLLYAQISRTAGQFDGVDNVILEPESLFQP
jgi:spore germination protein GerM